MRSILSLDVPLLLRVFSFLATVDKQRVAATCRYLSKLVAEPSLWTRANLRSLARASRAQLAQLLTTRRYSLLRALDLSDCAAVPVAELLAWCRHNPRLASLSLANTSLEAAAAFPLASSLAHVARLGLANTRLTPEQLSAVLGRCCRGRHTRHVDLSFNDLTYVAADLLAASVTSLHSLNLSYTNLSPVQARRLLDSVTGSNISELDLSGNQLTDCKLDNIALNQNLARLTLAEVSLAPASLDAVFTNLSLVHRLQELVLAGTALGHADPILLSDCVVRVARVDLNFCWLYQDHIEFILDGVTHESKLRSLNLSGNHFEDVSVELLLTALPVLHELRLEWANLTEEQCRALVQETGDLGQHNVVVLNHFEMIDNYPDLHRQSKLNPNIKLSMVKG